MLSDELILQSVVDEVFGCDTRVDEALDLPDEIAFVEALTEACGDACPALLTGKGDAEDEALYGGSYSVWSAPARRSRWI